MIVFGRRLRNLHSLTRFEIENKIILNFEKTHGIIIERQIRILKMHFISLNTLSFEPNKHHL